MTLRLLELSDGVISLPGNGEKNRITIQDQAPTIDAKILSALEKEPFYSAHSLAEVVGVSYSTVNRHLRERLGIKISICAGFHMG
jgi:DNA-binding transcriptional ArsR family regulator